jgi:excisionase family DNA binding protein
MNPSDSSEFLNINEAARYLGVNPRTIYRHVWSGKLPALRAGGLYRIRRSDLEAFLLRGKPSDAEPPEAGETAEGAAPGRRCGVCFRVLLSTAQAAGTCERAGCVEPICASCHDQGSHFCLQHQPDAAERLLSAKAALERGEIPLLVRAVEARLGELSFLSRIQARISAIAALIHPLSEEVQTVAGWAGCIELGDERAEVMRLMKRVFLDADTLAQVPLNAWLVAIPPLPSGAKGKPFEIHARVLSRLEVMVRDGFDTHPLDGDMLARILVRLAEENHAESAYRLILLAAPTGWDVNARRIVEGDAARQPFMHLAFQVFLYDMEQGELIFNRADERAARYAELFVPRTPAEEIDEAVRAVEKELLVYDSLTLEHAGSILAFRSEILKQAFQRLAQQGKFTLVDVPQLGPAILRK